MSLFPDIQPSNSGGAGSDWSYFPAQSTVDLAGNQINNGTASLTSANVTALTVGTINGSAPNSGVMSLTQGPGISVYGVDPQHPTIANTGVLAISNGAGITISGAPETPTIINSGVVGVIGGTGIGITNPTSQTPTIVNMGVVSVSAGTNISVGGTPQNPVISATPNTTYNVNQEYTPPTGTVNLSILDANKIWPIRCASGGAVVTLPNPVSASIPAGTWFIITNVLPSTGVVTVTLTGLSYSVPINPGQSVGFVAYQSFSGIVNNYTQFC